MKTPFQLSNSWLGSLAILLFLSLSSKAVVCSELNKLSLQECSQYDFIAYGRIDAALNCEEGSAQFTPVSVYKGKMEESIELFTSCEDGGIPLAKGEYWILFGDLNNAQEIQLNICSHSRRKALPGEMDYSSDVRGTTFEDDLAFLEKNFTQKIAGQNELLPKKYEKIDPVMVPVLLGIGLIFMIVGYFFIRKKK